MRSWRAEAAQGDLVLLLLSVMLMGIGLVAIASASIEYGDFHFGNPWHHTQRHAFYLIIGLVAGGVLGQLQRLSDNHSRHFSAEVFINGTAIDHDVATACP